jgi:hypothetical protein
MRTVAIESVEIDEAHGLIVRPHISPHEDFEFIFRTATGVRWNSTMRALTPVSGSTPSHAIWFGRIVDAMRDEYACTLALTSTTGWKNVPPELREVLEGVSSGGVV